MIILRYCNEYHRLSILFDSYCTNNCVRQLYISKANFYLDMNDTESIFWDIQEAKF